MLYQRYDKLVAYPKNINYCDIIFATLIFANEDKNMKVFATYICECLILKNFATLIFANEQVNF